MMHRKIYEENRNLGFIIVKNLDLSKFKDEVEKLISISTGEDKLLFITTYIENNIKPIDIFSNLMFYNETEEINDLVKFYLIYALSLLNKNLMKKYFPNIYPKIYFKFYFLYYIIVKKKKLSILYMNYY